MSKFEFRAIFLSVLAAAAGLALAFYFKAGHWFGRAGSIVTAIAIVFAALNLRERVAKSTPLVAEQFKRSRTELLEQVAAAGLGPSAVEAVVAKVELEARTEVAEAARQTIRRLLRVEVTLFVVGTLVWGFGDLPLDCLFRRQAASPPVERADSNGLCPPSASSSDVNR